MIVVFVGPSIPAVAVRETVDALVLPPARQGDILRVARHRPLAIALIDGYFHNVPAVWHKEILWALDQGIHVLGGASMGAIRAAELTDFGMVGVGRIFEQFRDGILTDDDEVALRHADAEHCYRALSEPMVNIRATVEAAIGAAIIDEEVGSEVLERAKRHSYPDRSWRLLTNPREWPNSHHHKIAELSRWVSENLVDQKRLDAEATLLSLREIAERGAFRAPVDFRFERTALWEQLVREAGELIMPVKEEALMSPVDDLLIGLDVSEERRGELERLAAARILAVEESRRLGHEFDEAEIVDLVHDFRRSRNLWETADLEHWLLVNKMTLPRLVQLVEEEARVHRVLQRLRGNLSLPLADVLRVDGTYDELVSSLSTR